MKTEYISDLHFECKFIDKTTAIIKLNNTNYIVDYSLLMDIIIGLSEVASEMESQRPSETTVYLN